jgi:peptidoglycan/xylan/chitin deacetylase (PgdA/CDA1 family)
MTDPATVTHRPHVVVVLLVALALLAPASASASTRAPAPGTPPGVRHAPPTTPVVRHPTAEPFVPTYVQRVKTRDRVVFLTIDDGVFQDPAFLALVRRQHLRFTVFLTNSMAGGKRAAYFTALQRAGAVIEDHTLTHPRLTRVSASERSRQICRAARDDKLVFGRRAQLLRPPYGDVNASVLAAAKACGLHAVVGWDAVMPQSGQLQTWFGKPVLHPGDIVLMHFLPGMTGQVQRLEALIAAQHLRLALLEDYL